MIMKFAMWMGSKDFEKDIYAFAKGVKEATQTLYDAIVFLKHPFQNMGAAAVEWKSTCLPRITIEANFKSISSYIQPYLVFLAACCFCELRAFLGVAVRALFPAAPPAAGCCCF